jgi:hypothetical protein
MNSGKLKYRFIIDFSNTRIPGSTGQDPWFEIPDRNKKFLPKDMVLLEIELKEMLILIDLFNREAF